MTKEKQEQKKDKDDWLRTFSESTGRLASAWTDAMKSAGMMKGFDVTTLIPPQWAPASGLPYIWNPPAAAGGFQELVKGAAKDLPDLLAHAGDEQAVRRIRERWLKSYEHFSRRAFGIPAPNETQRFLDQWRLLLGVPAGASKLGGHAFPDPMKMFFPWGWLPGSGTHREGGLLKTWLETYEQVFRKIFPAAPEKNLADEFHDHTKQALDAQILFLNTLPSFQDHLLSTVTKSLDTVLERILQLKIKETTEETYRFFFKTWLTSNEEAFTELLTSEAFTRNLAETVSLGLEANRKMESLVADGLFPFESTSRKKLQEMNEAMASMKLKMEGLEGDMEAVRRQMEELRSLLPDTADRT